MEFSSPHSMRWLSLSTVSRLNWNLEFWFLWMDKKQRTRRKTHGAGMRTNKKHNTHLTPGPGILGHSGERQTLSLLCHSPPPPRSSSNRKKGIDLFKCSVSFVLKDVMYLISILLHKVHLCKLKGFIHAGTVNGRLFN